MRLTARFSPPKGAGRVPVARGASIPAPIGGWDALSPLAAMPAENAVELVNWFPQPGYVEIRRGYVSHSDTGTASPVETVMGYQGPSLGDAKLFAASGGSIWDVTTSTPAEDVSGLTSDRWQHTNFTTAGGNFLWTCNGLDDPRYFDGSAWSVASITGVTGAQMISVAVYRNRLWTVLRNSTKAAYLDVNSIQGAATEFDVGGQFTLGGFLMAIGTWSTDTTDGPDEYIAFISSYGEVAIYHILDPADPLTVSYLGTATIGPPVGRRCLTKIGSDLAVISIDGVLPLSQVLSYDRAALLKLALTKNIQPVVTQAARDRQTTFGWQIISYPKSNMAIMNVPLTEGTEQEQFVMNTITGAWCRFTGQNANCWEIFEDRAFFGGNDGIVYLADEAGVDDSGFLEADMRGAYQYYGRRGGLKRWTMLRPLITSDGQVTPGITMNVDFREDAPIAATASFFPERALWDVAIWDVDQWGAEKRISAEWQTVAGIGYCGSIRMRVEISTAEPVEPIVLQVSSFDVLMEDGGFV